MGRSLGAVVRGAFITALAWAPLGGLTWMTLRALQDRGTLHAAGDVRALRLGILALVLFLASLLGAYVAGRVAIAEGSDPRPGTTLLAACAPVLVCLAAEGVHLAVWGVDGLQTSAFLGAAAVGGLTGGLLATLRGRFADDEGFYDRARRNSMLSSGGWRNT